MTRAEWLAQTPMLETGADRAARWVKKYNFPVQKVAVSALPGFVGHADTRVWGGTDHTDPGVNFPWDVFIQLVKDRVHGAPKPNKEPATMNQEQSSQLDRVNHELTHHAIKARTATARNSGIRQSAMRWRMMRSSRA